MKLFLDFFPVVIFFLVYKMAPEFIETISPLLSDDSTQWLKEQDAFIVATIVLIPASMLPIVYTWLTERKIEKVHVFTLLLVILLGALTVYFNNEAFVKWKPTLIKWAFAIGFIASQFTKQTLLERMMPDDIHLPERIWKNLNYLWVGFFIISGLLNLFVAYNFSTDTWVNFKLFGMLGITLIFIIFQGIYLSKHINQDSL